MSFCPSATFGRVFEFYHSLRKPDLYRGTCEVCLKTYNSRSTRKDDLNRHKKYFSLDGTVICPQCKEEVIKMSLTSHFQEKHPPNTCCMVCLEIMPNLDKKLRNHILKQHQIKPVCHLCGKSAYRYVKLFIQNFTTRWCLHLLFSQPQWCPL